MKKTVTIPIEELNVLRKTFKQAEEILNRLGMQIGSETPPKKAPRETVKDKKDRFRNLIESGARAKKPDHLKK